MTNFLQLTCYSKNVINGLCPTSWHVAVTGYTLQNGKELTSCSENQIMTNAQKKKVLKACGVKLLPV